jgi:hypothetical protein
MYNLPTFEAFTPRSMLRLGLGMMQQSAAAVRALTPWTETRFAWQELQNKLEAFELFEYVDSVLKIPCHTKIGLRELVNQAQRLGPYRAVWATEGLGHWLTERVWNNGAIPGNLLTGEYQELPEKGLAALHSGMGLAIAARVMKSVSTRGAEPEIRRALEQFLTLCQQNSCDGYAPAAYESLGLVTRNLYPHLVRKLDHQLKDIGEDLVSYFWHGVGRGVYFTPTNSLPERLFTRALGRACQEAPHESGRRNAISGLAWAMTLVNIRHPQILENFLHHNAAQLTDSSAFIEGVSSSVMIWHDSTVDDSVLKAFCNYQPDPSDRTRAERWEQMVHRPCMNALEHLYPELKRRRGLGKVFRCHDANGG